MVADICEKSGGRAGRGRPRAPLGLVRNPIVGLVRRIAAPAKQRVVDGHPGFELREIVGETSATGRAIRPRSPAACGARLRPAGVRARGRSSPAVRARRSSPRPNSVDHRVEAAAIPAVAPEHSVDVERLGAEPLGDLRHVGRCDEKDHRFGVDEPPDQPRAGNPVDLGPAPRYPQRGRPEVRAAALCASTKVGRPFRRQSAKPPSSDARSPARMAQQRGRAGAGIGAVFANHDRLARPTSAGDHSASRWAS